MELAHCLGEVSDRCRVLDHVPPRAWKWWLESTAQKHGVGLWVFFQQVGQTLVVHPEHHRLIEDDETHGSTSRLIHRIGQRLIQVPGPQCVITGFP